MNLPPVILASTSPRRAELLKQLGVKFKVIASEAPEAEHGFLTAMETCQLNAYRKARAVAKKHPDSLVLGADTLVYLDGKPFGKPSDLEDAARMLAQLAGKQHHVVTGVCLIQLRAHRQSIFADITDVKFRQFGDKEIRVYLGLVNTLDKAGAYAIQEHGNMIVERISGSLSNVVGLPLERLREELQRWETVEAA
jgi:septum formation protein